MHITHNLKLLLQKPQINCFLQLLYTCTMPQGQNYFYSIAANILFPIFPVSFPPVAFFIYTHAQSVQLPHKNKRLNTKRKTLTTSQLFTCYHISSPY